MARGSSRGDRVFGSVIFRRAQLVRKRTKPALRQYSLARRAFHANERDRLHFDVFDRLASPELK